MKLTKSDRIIKVIDDKYTPARVSLFQVLHYSSHSAFILWGNLCRGLKSGKKKYLEQLVESELLKITKYHTTTKIGSPKLNYNFFFILQHNVIVFILLQSTRPTFVHLAKVTTVFCGAYIPIIPIISATDFWRYVSLLLLPSLTHLSDDPNAAHFLGRMCNSLPRISSDQV